MKYIAMCRCEDGTMAHTGEQVDKLSAHPDLGNLVEGGVFVDFAGCDDDLVGIAPIFDPKLGADDYESFELCKGVAWTRMGLAAWTMWWEGQGAKVGYRANGKLVWSTGESIGIGKYEGGRA